MITYISKNVIKGDFTMTTDVGMSRAKYDITDLFEWHEPVVDAQEPEELIL